MTATLLLFTGCTEKQMQGTYTGGMLGGIFGSSVGGLLGGARGSNAGTAIGMAVGAVIGNAATQPRTKTAKKADTYGEDTYAAGSSTQSAAPAPSSTDGLSVKNIRFVDADGSKSIDAGESAEIIFEIHNDGSDTVYNITPVVTCDAPKYISISPTAIVADLLPGKAVVYTAHIQASPRLKDGEVTFRLAFQDGKQLETFKEFTLPTHAK